MTGNVEVVVKPLGPLHLGMRSLGPAEEFSVDRATELPLPSTVLGALGNSAQISISVDCDTLRRQYDFSDLRILAQQLFGLDFDPAAGWSEEPLLWGPLLRSGNDLYIPLGRYAARPGELPRLLSGKAVLTPYAQASAKTGVRLGYAKTAEAMFKAAYVAYTWRGLEIVYYAKNLRIQAQRLMARVGGEGRLALISINVRQDLPQHGGRYAVALQPVLIYGEEPVEDISRVRGLECVDEVVGVYDGEKFKPLVVDVGLGFSEVCKFRRPLLKALPRGTVLKLKNWCKARAVGLLSQLGYGSIYRFGEEE